MRSPFNKILIIGLGQMGLSVAKYVKERGLTHMDMILIRGYGLCEKNSCNERSN
jgi:prephenate dehydrogenase